MFESRYFWIYALAYAVAAEELARAIAQIGL